MKQNSFYLRIIIILSLTMNLSCSTNNSQKDLIDYENRFFCLNKKVFIDKLIFFHNTNIDDFDSLFNNLSKDLTIELNKQNDAEAKRQSIILKSFSCDNDFNLESIEYIFLLALRKDGLVYSDSKWYEDADKRLSYKTQIDFLGNWLDDKNKATIWSEIDILSSSQRKNIISSKPDSIITLNTYYSLNRDYATLKIDELLLKSDSIKDDKIKSELQYIIKCLEGVKNDSLVLISYSYH